MRSPIRVLLLFWGMCAAGADTGGAVAGLWHATVFNRENKEVAFQLKLTQHGNSWQGALVNGKDRVESSAGHFSGNKLRLEFDYWDGVLEAELRNGEWEGTFTRQYRKEKLVRKFHAQRKPVWVPRKAPAANFSGDWLLSIDADGKHSVARALIRQKGAAAEAAIAEISGDSGSLVGIVEGRNLVVSRFDGIRATRFELTMNAEGRVEGLIDSRDKVTGARVEESHVEAPEAGNYTRMKGAADRFRFSYPDLDGKTVSSGDERFRGKVLLVTITGSWCPNCHDEAPLLNEFYRKYHAQGLEIVALGFEYTGETGRDLRQLRLFRDKYKIEFPILLAGTTEDAPQKLAQLENFGAYPTAIFVGRDGRVRGIHAGFDGPATGARYGVTRKEMESTITALLAEPGV